MEMGESDDLEWLLERKRETKAATVTWRLNPAVDRGEAGAGGGGGGEGEGEGEGGTSVESASASAGKNK